MVYFESLDFFALWLVVLAIGVGLRLTNRSLKGWILLSSLIFAGFVYSESGTQWLQLLLLVAFLFYQFLLLKAMERWKATAAIARGLWLLSLVPLVTNKLLPIWNLHLFGFIGLSYMSFKTLQILLEVMDGVITEPIGIIDFLQFLLFFPTISSGPIDRSRHFTQEINQSLDKTTYLNLVGEGIQKILFGVLYKMVIAAFAFHQLKILVNHGTVWYVIQYSYWYTAYLFFDFAGYSLMAVGSSYVLGIQTPMNFNQPFRSIDIKDFWNRWHITLSTWLRDFVFSRCFMWLTKKKIFKQRLTKAMAAYMINMGLMGLWHGVSWSYIVYGLYHGILMAGFEFYQKKSHFYKQHKQKRWYQVLSWFVTMQLVIVSLFIFSGEAERLIYHILTR